MSGHATVAGDVVRRLASILRLAAFVSVGLVARAAGSTLQEPGQVRLSLLEASAGGVSRSCTLEVLVSATAGEATLSCERSTPPVSHLAARRPLTTPEAARLYALASDPASPRPQESDGPAPATADGGKTIITIERGNRRVVLDASRGPDGLSRNHQQTLRMLREIADQLRGARRRPR